MTGILTWRQLKAALLERAARPAVKVPAGQLPDYLAAQVLLPFEVFLGRVQRLEEISEWLLSETVRSDSERRSLVSEFQDILEAINLEFQAALLVESVEIVE